jgi:hypothetical protein
MAHSADLISEHEIPSVFTDAAVARIVATHKLPRNTNIGRLAEGLRASATEFVRRARAPTPNSVHRELDWLQRAARNRRYADVERRLRRLTPDARNIAEDRASRIRRGPTFDDQLEDWGLPDPDRLCDSQHRNWACEIVQAIITLSGRYVAGRLRPDGKRSREWRATVLGPAPSRSEPRRKAEQYFALRLRADYAAATGSAPARFARYNMAGPFVRLVGECLTLARAPTSDLDHDRLGLAVELVNDIERKLRQSRLTGQWHRLLEPILHIDAVAQVSRLVEEGRVEVRRLSSGEADNYGGQRPALIEVAETGQLCFLASPKQWRTIKVKPGARARIMRLAESLIGLPVHRRRRGGRAPA